MKAAGGDRTGRVNSAAWREVHLRAVITYVNLKFSECKKNTFDFLNKLGKDNEDKYSLSSFLSISNSNFLVVGYKQGLCIFSKLFEGKNQHDLSFMLFPYSLLFFFFLLKASFQTHRIDLHCVEKKGKPQNIKTNFTRKLMTAP